MVSRIWDVTKVTSLRVKARSFRLRHLNLRYTESQLTMACHATTNSFAGGISTSGNENDKSHKDGTEVFRLLESSIHVGPLADHHGANRLDTLVLTAQMYHNERERSATLVTDFSSLPTTLQTSSATTFTTHPAA